MMRSLVVHRHATAPPGLLRRLLRGLAHLVRRLTTRRTWRP
jgi:hypothetical protein